MKTSIFLDKQVCIHGSIIKFFFVMALLSSQLCYGQDYVYINTNDTCIGTITRYYGDRKPIHYMKTSARNGKFLLDWDQSLQQYTRTYPLYGYDVTDFTVVGDTLFFCGNDPNRMGFYGWVNIGGQPWWQFNIYSLSNNDEYITDVSRIRVFYGDRFPTILMIGNYVDQNHQINTSAVVHIKDSINCEVAHSTDDYFDDIVVLDDHVVTVARKGHNDPHHAPHYMRVLHKNNFSLNDTMFETLYMWGRSDVNDRILAQYVGLNSFVSVCHNDTALFLNTYSVNSSGALNPHRHHSMRVNINEPIRDLTYNDFDSTLMVIHKADNAVIASVFKRHTMPYLYFTWSWSAYPDVRHFCTGCNTSLMSTSKILLSNYMVSGVLQDKMVVWKTDTPCKHDLDFRLIMVEYQIKNQLDRPTVAEFTITGIQSYSESTPTPFHPVCERGKSEPIENSEDN